MADNTKEIICPACGKQMKKIYVSDAKVNVDVCTEGCGGIYFDNRELEKFDETHENADEIFAAIKGKKFEAVDEDKIRKCPVCHTPMVKMGSGKGKVVIDVCNTCGGKFLDNKEIEIIRNSLYSEDKKLEGLIDSLMREDYRSITHRSYDEAITDSPRRKAFEDFIMRFM